MSCSFEPTSRHLLVSTRPSQKHPNVRHMVYEISENSASNENTCTLNLIQTYTGASVQKLLAKSKLFNYNSQLYGVAPDEPS